MAGPKKHHFLPQFYLRRFADPGEKLWLYGKAASSEGIPTHVLKAGMENHFHTLDWSRWGTRPDDRETIERELSKIEGAQAELLRQILDQHEPSEGDIDSLTHCVTVMWHRVPSFKRSVEDTLSKLLAHTGRTLLKAGAFPPPPEELKSLIQERDGDIFVPEIANWKLLEFMFHQLRDTPIPGILSRMNCRLVRPGTKGDFFESVVAAFVRIRGESLNRGLVFREFVDLMPVGRDVMSGRTVFEEYRLFFFRGKLLRAAAHDDGGGVWDEFSRWEKYARRFDSPFITIDVTRRIDGRWIIVEAGDAGVSGLPAVITPGDFYEALREAFSW